ncbi:MAG: ParA family protein [Gammaproteobacteria bacterium]|nr:ParA family protein [Gammaproteobacteria bacterium]
MYVCTFYSFKGGVGRTMALVNTGVDLAQRGRRVLLVDFDLEAPGLDTFPLLQPDQPTPGIVDYVRRYLTDERAPDAREYVGESREVDNLFLMPSGAWGTNYAATSAGIDWGSLYAERDGYLLFEDLKEQWRTSIQPDYVLVDSRTGYTDTGGICTRQLPDAVTVLFFPNEQNLRGLTRVVGDIRAEPGGPRKKPIDIHFVMSNVPDLDDEDEVLADMNTRFQQELSFDDDPLVVHRYDSLSLLNQTVFARDRPRSRLAREYRAIANRVVSGNLSDRDGALRSIREVRRYLDEPWGRPGPQAAGVLDRVGEMERLHASDAEVLYRLGEVTATIGMSERAEHLVDRAIAMGYRDAEAYLQRSELRVESGDHDGAVDDARNVLKQQDVAAHAVLRALELLGGSDDPVSSYPAVVHLDAQERLFVGNVLAESGSLDFACEILGDLVADREQTREVRDSARSNLALAYMGSGKHRQAADSLTSDETTVDQLDVRDSFNLGMAMWAVCGEVDAKPFERVVHLDACAETTPDGPNYPQCLAVAHWAAGNRATALDFARLAQEGGHAIPQVFSCWRYRTVPSATFVDDVQEIIALIEGDTSRKPHFMT